MVYFNITIILNYEWFYFELVVFQNKIEIFQNNWNISIILNYFNYFEINHILFWNNSKLQYYKIIEIILK